MTTPLKKRTATLLCSLLAMGLSTTTLPAADAPTPSASAEAASSIKPLGLGSVYSLEQFGKIGTPAEAQASFIEATRQIQNSGGGVLLIPGDASTGWRPQNFAQEQWRSPQGTAPTTRWGAGPGVTVVDTRGGTMKILPPQTTGLEITRTLNLPQGESLPHWDLFPMVAMNNAVLHGATSYRDWIQEDVPAGPDSRIYLATIRGMFPGMFINAGSDWGAIQRIFVKSLGYDAEKNMWYVTADTTAPIKKGGMLSNKNHVNVMRMETFSHTENQTFDLMVHRHNYSQGDNYLIDARFKYMGDIHSTSGDENGVLYAAFVESDTTVFRATVDSWDPKKSELKYKAANTAATLGSGRPLINLNPKKWVQGNVWIVRPASWMDDEIITEKNPSFQGKRYPTTIDKNKLGNISLVMGGLIRFPKDAGVTPEVIGRYFAVDEATEYVPKAAVNPLRRWYLIDSVTKNADGTSDMRIIRHWWGAKSAGAPTLYNPENYSSDGHEKLLKCIIAPGVNVYDVSDGVESPSINTNGSQKILRLSPAPFTNTAMDFAAGDQVEQAIGPDPFRPVPFRSWLFEQVPGAFPSPVFDVANNGEVQRAVVMDIRGGDAHGDSAKDIATRYDHATPWNKLFEFNAASNEGIIFAGDTVNAAISFRQPNGRAQPIKWNYDNGKKEASVTVSPTDGIMRLESNGVSVPGGVVQLGGISATTTPASNLRGIAVPVNAGNAEITIKFQRPEKDTDYAVFLETNWLTARVVTEQTTAGFTVKFEKPAGPKATMHWLIVR